MSLPLPPRAQPGDHGFLEAVNREPWVGQVFRGSSPGRVPAGFSGREQLERIGLVDRSGTALLRLNEHRGKVFLTDGAWSLRAGGLFPWSDESADLLGWIERSAAAAGAETIVDLATGCGHTAIVLAGLAGVRRVFALDIEPRSEAFVAVNSQLAGTPVTFRRNDVCMGLPAIESPGPRLVVANLPDALGPAGSRLPVAIAGGSRGTSLAHGALKVLRTWMEPGTTAALLTYSLADPGLRRFEIVELAEREFGPEPVSWELLKGAKLWRVNGRKEQDNPMPLARLAQKASCRLVFDPESARGARESYRALAYRLERSGWASLAYGVLAVRL